MNVTNWLYEILATILIIIKKNLVYVMVITLLDQLHPRWDPSNSGLQPLWMSAKCTIQADKISSFHI